MKPGPKPRLLSEYLVANPPRIMRPGPTLERLKECLDYDPETGVFTWKERTPRVPLARGSNTQRSGRAAGYKSPKGYFHIGLDGVRYPAHRLAWLYMTGEWPSHEVDHKDGTPSNNSWSNLRAASRSQQLMNAKVRKNSRSGLKGIRLHRQSGLWNARVQRDGVVHSLGYFKTPEAAHAAYVAAAKVHFGEFARTE